MKIIIITDGDEKPMNVKKDSTIREIAVKCGFSPNITLAIIDDIPTPLDQKMEEGEVIKFVNVASGG